MLGRLLLVQRQQMTQQRRRGDPARCICMSTPLPTGRRSALLPINRLWYVTLNIWVLWSWSIFSHVNQLFPLFQAVHSVSKDTSFDNSGIGKFSRINYRELYDYIKRFLTEARDAYPRWYDKLMKKWNQEVFAFHNQTGSNIPIGGANTVLTADEQIENEIQRAMAGLTSMDSDTDDEAQGPRSESSAATIPPNSSTPPGPPASNAPSDEDSNIYVSDSVPTPATIGVALLAPILVRDIYQSHLISTFWYILFTPQTVDTEPTVLPTLSLVQIVAVVLPVEAVSNDIQAAKASAKPSKARKPAQKLSKGRAPKASAASQPVQANTQDPKPVAGPATRRSARNLGWSIIVSSLIQPRVPLVGAVLAIIMSIVAIYVMTTQRSYVLWVTLLTWLYHKRRARGACHWYLRVLWAYSNLKTPTKKRTLV